MKSGLRMRRRLALRLLSTALLSAAVFAAALSAPPSVEAQHDTAPSSTPPPPAGEGQLTVQVTHPFAPEAAAGLEIALYALAPDGRPGFAKGLTDASGRFVFEGLSADPGIVYLAGVRHAEIPFGERITFPAAAAGAAGPPEVTVQIAISDPTNETTGVEVEELRARVDWLGDRLRVREILRLRNTSGRVILVSPGQDARPIVSRTLSPNSSDFSKGSSSIGEDLALIGREVQFWGPLYQGEQRVEFEYALPIPDRGVADAATGKEAARRAELIVSMKEAIGRVVLVAGTPGTEPSAPGLIESSAVESESGQPLLSWARAGLGANEPLPIQIRLPAARRDIALLTMPRSDYWLEVDDTQLAATVDMTLDVPPGPPLTGSPEQPLLRITLPDGAALGGVDPKAEALGLVSREDGGFDVIGPIAPGQTSLGFAFRMPTTPQGIDLGLRLPMDVATLNVLIADTGLALESGRLHRRRPFRSGTRNFLHREAFNVSPNETVDLQLKPLSGAGIPTSASTALTLAGAVAGALFLIAPLRSGSGSRAAAVQENAIAAEREALYETIRDLDHDFETGKVESGDYERMRGELRTEAIALLKREREADAGRTAAAGSAGDEVRSEPASSDEASPDRAALGAFCPGCGGAIQPQWRFCSHCGGALAGDSAAGGAGPSPTDEQPG